jgi:hypothetical protein
MWALLWALSISAAPPPRELMATQCWGLDMDRRIKLMPDAQRTPVCLTVDVLPHTNAISLQIVETPPLGGKVCVQVQSMEMVSGKGRAFRVCHDSSIDIPLGKPNVSRAYLFEISDTLSVDLEVEARSVGALGEPPAPPYAPALPYPPPMPSPREECLVAEERVLVVCDEDADQLGCLRGDPTPAEEIECLELNLDEVSDECVVRARSSPPPSHHRLPSNSPSIASALRSLPPPPPRRSVGDPHALEVPARSAHLSADGDRLDHAPRHRLRCHVLLLHPLRLPHLLAAGAHASVGDGHGYANGAVRRRGGRRGRRSSMGQRGRGWLRCIEERRHVHDARRAGGQ